jgi:hypothetical protein
LDHLRPIATCPAMIDHLHIGKAAYFLGTKRRLNNRAIDGLLGDLRHQVRYRRTPTKIYIALSPNLRWDRARVCLSRLQVLDSAGALSKSHGHRLTRQHFAAPGFIKEPDHLPASIGTKRIGVAAF